MGTGRRNRALQLISTVIVIALASAEASFAQSNEELEGSFQFNFHTPGARSLALGRAFTGRADDATAAYANPAGLVWLTRPEVSVEGRWSRYSTEHVDGGRANGEPTGIGIDTIDHVVFSQTERETTGLSFVSLTYPIGPSWRIAVYRHELANFRAAIDKSQGVFFELPRLREGRVNHGRVRPVQASLDLDLVNYGVSGAYRVNNHLWAGLGVSYFDFSFHSVWEGFRQPSPNPDDPDEVSFDPAVFTPDRSLGTRTHDGEDQDVAVIGGLMWRTLNDRWTVGLVYRQGPELEFSASTWTREFNPLDGTFDPSAPCGQFADPPQVPCGDLAFERSGTFKAPDVYSLGATFRPTDRWTLSAEWDRVTYSDLRPSVNVLAIADSPEISLDEFEIDDGDEYHVGVEYAYLLQVAALYFRGGSWYDPDHQLRFEDRPPLSVTNADGVLKPTNDAVRLRARFPGGEDEIHWTGGVGISFPRFQIDAAYDLSDRTDIASLSAVVRF